jgi:hypothetical protein
MKCLEIDLHTLVQNLQLAKYLVGYAYKEREREISKRQSRSLYLKQGIAGHNTLLFCMFIKREAKLVVHVSLLEESLFWSHLYVHQIFSWRN